MASIKLSPKTWKQIEYLIHRAVTLSVKGYLKNEQEYFQFLSEQDITIEEVKNVTQSS